jgi:uncharacterized protein YjbI with pentapeptide repeats
MGMIRRTFIYAMVLMIMMGLQSLSAPAYASSAAAIRANNNTEIGNKNFAGKNLEQAKFSDAHLDQANFKKTKLIGVVFDNVTLTGATFQGADMSQGMAYRSDFSDANLEQVNFTDALLLKSTFTNAKITGADFTDASIDREQLIVLCESASGVNPVTKVATRDSLGCSD